MKTLPKVALSQEEISPDAIARECLEKCKGDQAKASKLMHDRLAHDEPLFRRIMEPLIDTAIAAIMGRLVGASRSLLRRVIPLHRGMDDTSGIAGMGLTWYSYMLRPGLALKDATDADLDAAIQQRRTSGKTMFTDARWFELIKKRKQGFATVGDACTPHELDTLREVAEAETTASKAKR